MKFVPNKEYYQPRHISIYYNTTMMNNVKKKIKKLQEDYNSMNTDLNNKVTNLDSNLFELNDKTKSKLGKKIDKINDTVIVMKEEFNSQINDINLKLKDIFEKFNELLIIINGIPLNNI